MGIRKNRANERLHLTAWGRGGRAVANVSVCGRAPMRQVKRIVSGVKYGTFSKGLDIGR